jgi:hypothetical protein
VGKIVFPRALISFSEGLDSVAKRSVLAFYRVALGIVRRCRRLSNAKCGKNFRDEVTQELGTSVAVYLVTDWETGKDLSLSTSIFALARQQGKASSHRVKQSETVSMYSLPFFDLGSGPTKSMLIF